MFDNVAFEVVIGLVFIYLLYSLLITILSELVATWLNIRGNLLRVAIEHMLNDGYYYKLARKKRRQKPNDPNRNPDKNQIWIRGSELKENPEFRHSFAGRFYDYPAIKYLGRFEKVKSGKLTLSKPAYISASFFAESVINFLADKGDGKTIMDKLNFCLRFNTHNIEPNTRRQFMNLFETSATLDDFKANLVKWFNETMDRTNGWYKRKLKLISFLLGLSIAIAFNVDTIKIAKILANDKEARSQLVDMGIAMSKDSARYKDFIVSNGDTLHTPAVLDTGFARIKNDLDRANLVLGLGWDFSKKLTEDTLNIEANTAAIKYIDSIGRIDSISQNISNTLEENLLILNSQRQPIDSLNKEFVIDSIQQRISLSYGDKRKVDSINNKILADTMAIYRAKLNYGITLAKIKIDSISLKTNLAFTNLLYSDINKLSSKKLAIVDSISPATINGTRIVSGKRRLTGSEKIETFFANVFWYSIIGFLLTALALSLGAPFWFDILNKIIAIRGNGVKPEEKKEEPIDKAKADTKKSQNMSEGLTPLPPNPVADITEAAYQAYGAALTNIPGVKSVFTVTKKGAKQLQVNVDNAITKGELKKQFPTGLQVNNTNVPIRIVESGVPVVHSAQGVIINQSGLNVFGSLGCIVEWVAAGTQHILSCWHVLKGDLNYSASDANRTIVESENHNIILAERWAGGIMKQFDYGLAECKENIDYRDNEILRKKLGITKKEIEHHSVSKDDIAAHQSVKYYNALHDSVTTGLIFTESSGVNINYLDKTRFVEDVLLLCTENEETISEGGNSGSVVFDMNDNAIAMIIGGDKKYTYAAKLSHIFNIHQEMRIASPK